MTLWFRRIAGDGRCGRCGSRGRQQWSCGRYVAGKWRTQFHFCEACFAPLVLPALKDAAASANAAFSAQMYGGQERPAWLSLEPVGAGEDGGRQEVDGVEQELGHQA